MPSLLYDVLLWYHDVLRCTISFHGVLFCTIMYYDVLCCPIMHYLALWCTMMYYDVLCCTSLHDFVLWDIISYYHEPWRTISHCFYYFALFVLFRTIDVLWCITTAPIRIRGGYIVFRCITVYRYCIGDVSWCIGATFVWYMYQNTYHTCITNVS